MNRPWQLWSALGRPLLNIFLWEQIYGDENSIAIAAVLNKLKFDPIILDVGCGPGVDANYWARVINKSFLYTGIDVTPDIIEIAKNRNFASKFMLFLQGDIFSIPNDYILSGHYNIVICKNVLEHLPSPDYSELNYKLAITNLCKMRPVLLILAFTHLLIDERTVIQNDAEIGIVKGFYVNKFNREEILVELAASNYVEVNIAKDFPNIIAVERKSK